MRFETGDVPAAGSSVFDASGTNEVGVITSAANSMLDSPTDQPPSIVALGDAQTNCVSCRYDGVSALGRSNGDGTRDVTGHFRNGLTAITATITRAAPACFNSRAEALAVEPSGQDVVDKQDRFPRQIDSAIDGKTPLLLQPALSRRTGGLFRRPTSFCQQRAAPAHSQLPGYFPRQGFGRVVRMEQSSRPMFGDWCCPCRWPVPSNNEHFSLTNTCARPRARLLPPVALARKQARRMSPS